MPIDADCNRISRTSRNMPVHFLNQILVDDAVFVFELSSEDAVINWMVGDICFLGRDHLNNRSSTTSVDLNLIRTTVSVLFLIISCT